MHPRRNLARILKQIPIMRLAVVCAIACVLAPQNASAQINMDAGFYSQNFDSLSANVTNPWLDNTIIPGWYASKSGAVATSYFGDTGTSTTGGLYSYAVNGTHSSTDRALGSIGSGTANPVTFGVRFRNNTVAPV